MTEAGETAYETSSYEISTIKFDLGPIRDELTRLFNEYHEARRIGDVERMKMLDGLILGFLDTYDRTESNRALNPLWRRRMMRAGRYHCRGEYDLALEYEREGWTYAQNPPPGVHPDTAARMQSISASNIADDLIRLGQSEEAVEWAKISIERWPNNSVNFLVLAIALYRAGHRSEAERIFDKLRVVANFADRTNALCACIEYEDLLNEMVELPSVALLLEEAHS